MEDDEDNANSRVRSSPTRWPEKEREAGAERQSTMLEGPGAEGCDKAHGLERVLIVLGLGLGLGPPLIV